MNSLNFLHPSTLFSLVVLAFVVFTVVLILLNKNRQKQDNEDKEDDEDVFSTLDPYYRNKYLDPAYRDTASSAYTGFLDPLSFQEASQQGQEEFDQVAGEVGTQVATSVKDTNEDDSKDASIENTTETDDQEGQEIPLELTSEGEVKVLKTFEEKLSFMYNFHSNPLENANRYSAVGVYEKALPEEAESYPSGYKLVVGYAVCSKKDKFSRQEGLKVATGHLHSDKHQYVFPVTEEELQYPGKTFTNLVKTLVPITVFDASNRHKIRNHFTDIENVTWDRTPSKSDRKRYRKYVRELKTAEHRLILAKIKVVSNPYCDSVELVVNSLQLMYDYTPPKQEEQTKEDTHTEQSF